MTKIVLYLGVLLFILATFLLFSNAQPLPFIFDDFEDDTLNTTAFNFYRATNCDSGQVWAESDGLANVSCEHTSNNHKMGIQFLGDTDWNNTRLDVLITDIFDGGVGATLRFGWANLTTDAGIQLSFLNSPGTISALNNTWLTWLPNATGITLLNDGEIIGTQPFNNSADAAPTIDMRSGGGGITVLSLFISYRYQDEIDTQGLLFNDSQFSFINHETDQKTFNILFNNTLGYSSITGTFFFNGTSHTTTSTDTVGYFNFSSTFDIPLIDSNSPSSSFWQFSAVNSSGTFEINSTTFPGTHNIINFSICGASPQDIPYINFTFANETTAQEALSASFLSTWTYFLGSGSITKSLTFNDATENTDYAFCGNPSASTFFASPVVTYDNSESQPRGYNPGQLTLTNTTTEVTLFLLPTGLGIFATIQVLNVAGNPISGARIVLSDTEFGNLESRTTSDSGTATFFVDPFNVYTITVSATGFETFQGTNMFATSEFTVILSGAGVNVTDPTAGITFNIAPTQTFLANNTNFTFQFDIDATLSNLDSYGFFISNGTDILGTSAIGTTETGSLISLSINTGNETGIFMNAFYIVGSQTQNVTKTWIVRDETVLTQWSIRNFADRLSTYLNQGIFGITDFGLSLLVFLLIFVITGVLSFRFGLNSPLAISSIVFTLVALFDVGLGIFPNPIGAIPNFPTVLIGAITLTAAIREVFK